MTIGKFPILIKDYTRAFGSNKSYCTDLCFAFTYIASKIFINAVV
jgi:hypothetical protein